MSWLDRPAPEGWRLYLLLAAFLAVILPLSWWLWSVFVRAVS